MEFSDIVPKKSLKTRLQNFFTSIVSVFIKKEKLLPVASDESLQALNTVSEEYLDLYKDDSFDGLKKTYDKYKIGVATDGGLIAIEKDTGYVMEDSKFVARVRFNALWRKSAFANLDIKDEEACVKECYGDNSRLIYEEIKTEIQKELKKTGNLDTKKVLDLMKESKLEWARVASRRLFKTPAYADTVYNYFRSITSKPKKQTKPTLSISQAIYGDIIDE